MKELNKNLVKKVQRPVKVVQFGEGNFLRAFVDYMIDIANDKGFFDGDIVIVKPINFGNLDNFYKQDYLYTVSLRGYMNGEECTEQRIVTSLADAVDTYSEYNKYAELAKLDTLRFVVSNTTEAGIVFDETDQFDLTPCKSYPGKLTKFLYERYQHFQGDLSKGLIILPVELIDDNGHRLKEIVFQLAKLWELEEGFVTWLQEACIFTSTLVDRIVTGFPRDEAEDMWKDLGYVDNLLVTGEPFGLWVIESDRPIKDELPLDQAGLPVIFTDNQKPYKQRKVRILNGAHTSFSLASYLAGNDYVMESMKDEDIRGFMSKTIFDEIIPTLDLPKEDLLSFANAVMDRFLNPYIKHELLSISLNSVSKWRARCMPSLFGYVERFEKLPQHLSFSLAALMIFYRGDEIRNGVLIAHRNGQEYQVKDDKEVLEFFVANADKAADQIVLDFLSNTSFWGQDLNKVPGLTESITGYVKEIECLGVREALRKNQLV